MNQNASNISNGGANPQIMEMPQSMPGPNRLNSFN